MYDGTLKRIMGWTRLCFKLPSTVPEITFQRSQIDAGAILSAIAPEDGESLHSFIERSLLQARMHAHVMIWRHSAGDAVDFYAHCYLHWAGKSVALSSRIAANEVQGLSMREMEEDPVSEIIRRNASGDADSRQPGVRPSASLSPGASSALASDAEAIRRLTHSGIRHQRPIYVRHCRFAGASTVLWRSAPRQRDLQLLEFTIDSKGHVIPYVWPR